MLGTRKMIEVGLVGWGGEAKSEMDAMEVVGEGGAVAMVATSMEDSELDIWI
jgi:hypothetical protein